MELKLPQQLKNTLFAASVAVGASFGAAYYVNVQDTSAPPGVVEPFNDPTAIPLEGLESTNEIYFNTFTINEQNNPLDTNGNPVFVNGETVGLFNSVPKVEDGPTAKFRQYLTIIGEGNPNRVPSSWFTNGQFDYNEYYRQVLQNYEKASQLLELYGLSPNRIYLKNTGENIGGQVILEGGPEEATDDCQSTTKVAVVLNNQLAKDDLAQNRAKNMDYFVHEAVGHLPFVRDTIAPTGSEALAEALDLTVLENILQHTGILDPTASHTFVLAQHLDRAVELRQRMKEGRPLGFDLTGDYDHSIFLTGLFYRAGIKDLTGIKRFLDEYIHTALSSPYCNDSAGQPVQFVIDSLKKIAPDAVIPSTVDGMISTFAQDILMPDEVDPELQEIFTIYRDIITPNDVEFTLDGSLYQGNSIRSIVLKKGYFQRYRFGSFDDNPEMKHLIVYQESAVVYGVVNGKVQIVESGSDLKTLLNDQGSLEVIIFNSTEKESLMHFLRNDHTMFIPLAITS